MELLRHAYSRSTTILPPLPDPNSGLRRSNTAGKKKAAAATAALQADVRDLSERMEELASSVKRRERSHAVKEKAAALTRSIETKQMQACARLSDVAHVVSVFCDLVLLTGGA